MEKMTPSEMAKAGMGDNVPALEGSGTLLLEPEAQKHLLEIRDKDHAMQELAIVLSDPASIIDKINVVENPVKVVLVSAIKALDDVRDFREVLKMLDYSIPESFEGNIEPLFDVTEFNKIIAFARQKYGDGEDMLSIFNTLSRRVPKYETKKPSPDRDEALRVSAAVQKAIA